MTNDGLDGYTSFAPHMVARKVSIDLPERFYINAPRMLHCQKVLCRYARKFLIICQKVFLSFANLTQK